MSLAQLPAPVELREIRALNSAYVRDQHQLKSGSITPEQAAERWQEMEPSWWGDIEMQGGVGFVSPGQVGETTLYLEPGLYELTCHIKTRDGKSHFIMGMRAHIRVTGEGSATVAPTAQAKLTVSSDGLVLAGELGRGDQLVEIHYTDSPDPLHDVHLAKLDGRDSELQAAHWMKGVQAPAPVIFLGGVGHLRGGESGYFSASYQPGHYMFLCQQHPEEQLVFEIPEV
ncbi:hypothetical protein [Microbulbifer yueqingensis]|nr:hypothetical protein [Microbulbifer yueqingensis]